MYIQIHTFTYTYIHIHTYTCIYVHMHTYTYIYRHRLTNTCVYMHIPTHTYIYIHIQTDTHIYIHIHTYTYIYMHCKWQHVCNDDSSKDTERKKISIPVKSSQVTHCKLSFPGWASRSFQARQMSKMDQAGRQKLGLL